MRYRALGKLPIRVSEIGLGTAQLANTDGQGHGVTYIAPAIARNIISVAIERGVNFFDTADQYGNAEVLLGELDSTTKSKIIIATKAGLKPDRTRDFSESYLLQQIDRSLMRLKVDRIDLFQLNKPNRRDLENGSLFSMLDQLKAAGKIKYSGVVVGDIETGDDCVQSGSVDCLQVLYNLLYSRTEELILKASQRGIGIIARSPLNSGVLSGTYTDAKVFPASDERSQYFSGSGFEDRLGVLYEIQQILQIDNKDLLEFSLQYILSNQHCSAVIPGASSVGQVTRYIECSGKARFDESYLVRIRDVVSNGMKKLTQSFQNN